MTKRTKQNCWEFMECGREHNGANVKKLGVCPASVDNTLNNKNSGTNAGRFCWKVVGSLCHDTIKATSCFDIISCQLCPFFKKVQDEEGKDFS
jgi:hypothetical protein